MGRTIEELLLTATGIGSVWLFYRLSPFYRTRAQIEEIAEKLAWLLPAILEPKEFCELVKLADEHSHYLERHGPLLKIEEILERAHTGDLTTVYHSGRPVNSSRWYSHKNLHHAVISALELWENGERPKGGRFNFYFPHNIGEGFLKGTSKKRVTNLAAVVIRNGSIISAYPILSPKAEKFVQMDTQ